jgi:methylmalonyl-CoA/ethylmalonyl-CoA epimerase
LDKNKSAATSTFNKVFQVGLVVRDHDKTIERLSLLGIGPFYDKILDPERKEWFRGQPMNARFKISGAKMGDIELEVIQPVSGDSPHKEYLENQGEGIQHIACVVDDIEKEIDRLTKLGVSVLLRAKRPEGGGIAYLDLDAGGLIVELVQKKKE